MLVDILLIINKMLKIWARLLCASRPITGHRFAIFFPFWYNHGMPKKCDIGHTLLDNKSLGNSDKTDILDISGRAGKNVFAPRHYEGTKINQRFSADITKG